MADALHSIFLYAVAGSTISNHNKETRVDRQTSDGGSALEGNPGRQLPGQIESTSHTQRIELCL